MINFGNIQWGLWNLFLAIIPFMISWYLYKKYANRKKMKLAQSLSLIFLSTIWLLFFPNIPYLFLDVRHILSVCEPSSLNRCFNHPGSILVLFSFATVGIPLFVISLEQMRLIITQKLNKITSFLCVGLIMPISSIGLHLGLIERFNSWNIVTHPFWIFKVIWKIFTTQSKLITIIEFSISLLLIYLLFLFFFYKRRIFLAKKSEK